ncbi:Predicted dehydrogenase [Sphingomonas palmae]|uniref:Predicted dehydrogenase n=1 Tax=Sphingomonas palmae TaxID=1855283 RepID=A0A1H7PJJ2_9SPHN|nr:Gfo/Idh/MocA family oxidoreductase [Sphingomonas palmae]SEL35776.1 Predicted dehydrogenase [Sphingomonas palmae]
MSEAVTRRPRLGFLGVGWIGRHRMEAMLGTGLVEAAAISDPSPDMIRDAAVLAPHARVVADLDAMLALDLDGVVIASPSALHAAQSIRALEAGKAVFCQKPLGRDAAENERVVAAARDADRLLGVDLSYRFTSGMEKIAELVRGGALGRLFAVDLVFHNAYGPDKPWFYDRAQSGGGCVMDLGIHLVDLAMWLTGQDVRSVSSSLFAGGEPLAARDTVEDYAVATLTLDSDVAVRLACSWRLNAGQDAVIEASFYGTNGGATMRNVGGSFYDFTTTHNTGTQAHVIASPPEEWGGRAAIDWARRLAENPRFDAQAHEFVTTARALDRIYAGR